MQDFRGIGVSPGVSIARAFVLDDARLRIPRRTIAATMVETERQRLRDAVAASQADLVKMKDQAETELGPEAANIFAFHLGLLGDPSLTEPMHAMIENEQVMAEYALQENCRVLAERFAGMRDHAFQTKVDDVWDLERRVLRHLIGAHASAVAELDNEAVIVSRDLAPSQVAGFARAKVCGFATDMGGPTSHMAIFARALGVPAVVGLRRMAEAIEEGDLLIIDGDRGSVILDPDAETIDRYRSVIRANEAFALSLAELVELPAETKDGVRIYLMGNIELAEEVDAVVEYGGDGVGLFRTEFLWLTSTHEPSEEEQYEQYVSALRRADGRPIIIRTFDLGADKYTQERALLPERNPFLGLRSIRYCLQNLPMFRSQLRAILRASAEGGIKVMFPLITNTSELRQARMILADVVEELREEGIAFDPGIEVGMMVETPAAAVMAPSFAKMVDFFSIGTNDLIQYTLAVDRTNELVASLYAPGHPAVLRLIKDVVRTGRRRQIDVSCCGEVAGDPEYTMLLVGLGLRILSATPSRIPYLKRIVRGVTIKECERLARTAGSFDSERRVAGYLRQQAQKYFPELFDGRSVGE